MATPGVPDPVLQTTLDPLTAPAPDALSDSVLQAWDQRCNTLSSEERQLFKSLACDGLHSYLGRVKQACEQHRDDSHIFRFLEWLEPLFKIVQLFMPAASMASQAHPNPSALVLGGVVGVLEVTGRLQDYQKLTLGMLDRMGRKCRIIREYETGLYKNDERVQKALVEVYGDIIMFCRDAVRILTTGGVTGKLEAKVRGLKLILFRDFKSQLGKHVEAFESDLEDLRELVNISYQKWLRQLLQNYDEHRKELSDKLASSRAEFQRREDIVNKLKQTEVALKIQMNEREMRNHHEQWLKWLSPLTFETLYDERCDGHLEGTGTWLKQSSAYTNWKSSPTSGMLWIRGKPGCGKSFLAAVAVSDLTCEEFSAYAFCRKGNESNESSSAILGALVKQIIKQKGEISRSLEKEYINSEAAGPPSMKAVRAVLYSALSGLRKVFLVIDALDENAERLELLHELRRIMSDHPHQSINVLVFSRPDHDIASALMPLCDPIQLDQGVNEDDLKRYIFSCFPKEIEDQELREACLEKAKGMFQWVKLVHRELQKPLTKKQKLLRVKDLPEDLDSMYGRIMELIWTNSDEVVRETAMLVLLWVTHAFRPLKATAMLEAVGDYSDAVHVQDIEKYDAVDYLVAICENLVFIDKDGYLSLIHESVRSYLDKPGNSTSGPLLGYRKQKEDAHFQLAVTCLKYLSLEDFEYGPPDKFTDLVSLAEKCPLMAYAAEFWGMHAVRGMTDALRDEILDFVASTARRELSMQVFLYNPANPDELWVFHKSSTEMHILAIFGLTAVAAALIDKQGFDCGPDGSGITPLRYALMHGHHEMTLWIVEQAYSRPDFTIQQQDPIVAVNLAAHYGWADVLCKLISHDSNLVDSSLTEAGPTPLIVACDAGEESTAIALIELGADLKRKDQSGASAMVVAAAAQLSNVVVALLKAEADPNDCDETGTTALHYAASAGNAAITTLLLNGDANAEWPDKESQQTPLHCSATAKSVTSLKALLELRPHLDINIKTRQGWTPLHLAAWYDSVTAAETLLRAKCAKDEVDQDGRTPLAMAIQQGALHTARKLLKGGCDAMIPDQDGDTPLHLAAQESNRELVLAILENTPRPRWKLLLHKRNKREECPLHCAVSSGNTHIVRILLESGADATMTGFMQSSPLHYAAHSGHKHLCRLLLNHTKEPNARNQNQDTPLHFAARASKLDFIVQLFQDSADLGLSVDTRSLNKWNKTALYLATSEGNADAAKHLFPKTPSETFSIHTDDGNHLIHMAAWHGMDTLVESLLPFEGTTSKGYNGRTPLHCAAIRGHLDTVRLLVPVSTSVLDEPDDNGSSPAFVALAARHVDIFSLLIEHHADHNIYNKLGNSLLHLAAQIDDLDLFQQLLSMGCDGSIANTHGRTPFHAAALADNVDMLDALVKYGFDGSKACDHHGNHCDQYAAEAGSLTMLRKLESLGTPLGRPNHYGYTAAHCAAECGHVDVLEYLSTRELDLSCKSAEGITPFMLAAWTGHTEAVQWFLQRGDQAIDDCTTLDRETALSGACANRKVKVVELLLNAGANPRLRDAHGLTAEEISATLKETKEDSKTTPRFNSTAQIQRKIQIDTLRYCIETLLDQPAVPSVAEQAYRLSRVRGLAKALRRLQDFETAKVCEMEVNWMPKEDLVTTYSLCDICYTNSDPDKLYICKVCYNSTHLCHSCWQDYINADKEPPKASEEIEHLERQLQPLRNSLSEVERIDHVYRAVHLFPTAQKFIEAARIQYDLWGHRHNSDHRHDLQVRPGKEWLDLLKKFGDLMKTIARDDTSETDEKSLKKVIQLLKSYNSHRLKHRADRELPSFSCKGHDYFLVSREEKRTLMSEGEFLGLEDGKITARFLRGVLERYKEPEGDQAHAEVASSTLNGLFTSTGVARASQGLKEADTAKGSSPSARPALYERSQTSIWHTQLPLQRSELTQSVPLSGNSESPARIWTKKQLGGIRKYRTLPIMSPNDSHGSKGQVRAGLRRAFSYAQAGTGVEHGSYESLRQVSQSINVTAMDVSIVMTGLGVISPIVPANEEVATPEDPSNAAELLLAPTLSSEPEPIDNVPAPEVERSQSRDDDNDDDETATNRIILMFRALRDQIEDEEDKAIWTWALLVTEAMVPGFFETKVTAVYQAQFDN